MLEIKPILNALRRSKAGAMMLLIQIAITTAIVSNAAFIINDRIEFLQQDTGYPEKEVFSFSVFTYGKDVDLTQKFEENEAMLRDIPGVLSASMIGEIPLSGSGSASSFHLDPDPTDSKSARAAYTFGDESVLDSLGVKVSNGRNFTFDDVVVSEDASQLPKVAIVSQAFLDELFPDGDGLGSTFYYGPNPLTVVGVVDKMLGPWLRDSAVDRLVIMPLVQASPFQKFVLRTQASDRSAVMRQIEDLMLADYNKRVINPPRPMDEAKDEQNAGDILMMRMLIVLIVVLILVTALGIFGLTVFNINKRTKQIGTRRALGARKSAIMRYFLVENGLICMFGLLLGSIAALFLGKELMSNYSIPELDIMYIVLTAVFVLIVSLLSVLMPASKAANISPSIATRSI